MTTPTNDWIDRLIHETGMPPMETIYRLKSGLKSALDEKDRAWYVKVDELDTLCAERMGQIQKLEAKIERLRGALEKKNEAIRRFTKDHERYGRRCVHSVKDCRFAEEALQDGGETK